MRTQAIIAIVIFGLSASASAQQTPGAAPENTTTTGTIVSLRPNTMILRTDDNRYYVFLLDRETFGPEKIAVGMRVLVESSGTAEDERVAVSITPTGNQSAKSVSPESQDAIPPNIRRLEQDIASTVRKYRIGVRGGIGLDPELVLIGAHAGLGPIFTRRLLFRPNVEFAYGELTTLLAVNVEAVYRLTSTMSRTRWTPYAGAGPAFGFSHRGFSTEEDDGRSFDFNDFDYNGGFSLVGGVEKASGALIELKATIYGEPHVRLLFGFTF